MFFTFSFTLFYLYYLRFCFAFFSNKIARENRHLMKHTCSNSNHFCASCASCARRSLDVTLPRSLQVLVHLILWREIRRTVGCFFKFIRLNRFYFGNFILKKRRARRAVSCGRSWFIAEFGFIWVDGSCHNFQVAFFIIDSSCWSSWIATFF